MLLVSSGPFKINGVPIHGVNQTYVIATSIKVDISGVEVEKFDDKFFARDKKTRAKKTEGELFETGKEVLSMDHDPFVPDRPTAFTMYTPEFSFVRC